jgi:hypothetical protein
MGTPTPISLGYRSNPARHQQAGAARLTNCFAEEQSADGKVQWVIYGMPGLASFGAPLGDGPIRAMLEYGSKLYVVSGRSVYTVNSSGVATLIGTFPTDGAVFIERNRAVPAQIGMVSDGTFYVINTTTDVVSQVTDADMQSPICLSFLDGYGILPYANGAFQITGLDDFTTFDATERSTCEAYPDAIVRSMTLEREAVFFGEKSIEWHQNTGDTPVPFTRSHATEIGCLAPLSVAKVDTKSRKTLIWVAPDHTVRAMNGYTAEVISSLDVEALIKAQHAAGNAATLTAFAWADGGRFFYALSCAAWTRIFNSVTNSWHDQKSNGLDRWRVGGVTPFGNYLIASDYASGQLYILSDSYFDEAGQELAAEIVTPTVHAFPYRLAFNALYVDAATGVGIDSTDEHEADPQVMVSWSDDGGVSWSAVRSRSLGAIGSGATRVQPIRRLGTCGQKGRIFKFRITAPVQKVMMQVSVDFDKLSA